jgi:hypothetical protein
MFIKFTFLNIIRMKNLKKIWPVKNTFLLLVVFEMLSMAAIANPGDTTWVTIFNNRKITQYGNYDTVANFPTGLRYRKMRLHYILGRYACPPGTQYCGSWDYTTQIYARPAGKDTVEIARVITPYATDWLASNRKHDYVVEVSDYAKSLEGNTAIRFKYDGYSWGFTITLKLELIEGIPPMDALSVNKVYDGYFPYGNSANPIENYLTAKTFSYSAPVAKNFIKNSVSGHGSDNTGCGEFCSKFYKLKINNNMVSQKQLWRADCGINHVYPQTGTWIYDRSNWCPGAVVWPIYHDISALTSPNTSYSVDVDMQPYTASSNFGGYIWASQVINYSQPNQSVDLSIEDIIAPTKDPNYFRNNPICTNPIIKIKNVGSSPITSAVFSYGLAGTTQDTYNWTGNLNFLDEAFVELQPPIATAITKTVDTKFNVNIVSVNGSAGDGNSYNNIYQSVAAPTVFYPDSFVVKMMTNNTGGSVNQTSWTLYDEYNNVVTSRTGALNNTLYLDTLVLIPGCYRFQITDAGCDGISWWNYANYNPNPGTGSLRFVNVNTGINISNFSGDFGCEYSRYFKVRAAITPTAGTDTGIKSFEDDNSIDVYPNPAQNMVYLKLDLNKSQDVVYSVSDINGKTVVQKSLGKVTSGYENIDVSVLNNGIYFVSVQFSNAPTVNKKIVIQR